MTRLLSRRCGAAAIACVFAIALGSPAFAHVRDAFDQGKRCAYSSLALAMREKWITVTVSSRPTRLP